MVPVFLFWLLTQALHSVFFTCQSLCSHFDFRNFGTVTVLCDNRIKKRGV